MRLVFVAIAAALLPAAAIGQEQPEPARLKADVENLVSFGTRHTLSSSTNPKRGIGAARRWFGAEMTRIGKGCGGCIAVSEVHRVFTGAPAPAGVNIVDVLGVQAGSEPNRVVIIQRHIDCCCPL